MANPIDSAESKELTRLMGDFIATWALPGSEPAMLRDIVEVCRVASVMGAKAMKATAMETIQEVLDERKAKG